MQITEAIIERIARRVFNSMITSAIRQNNAQGGNYGGVRYAEEAGHAVNADSADSAAVADSVAWAGITGKPSEIFTYKGAVDNEYVSGATYTTLTSGTYIRQLSGSTDSLIHFQADGSASGLDVRFSYSQASGNPLQYRKTIDSNRFAGSWVTLIDSINISNQSVSHATTATTAESATYAGSAASAGTATSANYATSAGNADTVDGEHANAFLHLTGGTMTGTINLVTNGYKSTTTPGMDCHNSDIINVNSIYTNDECTDWDEGIEFYRSDTSGWDSLYAYRGTFFFKAKNGNNYADIHASTGIAEGSWSSKSDARKKDIIGNIPLTVEQIAGMPAIIFKWKKGEGDNARHVGTLAQPWSEVMPEVVSKSADGTLSLGYGETALVSVITLARRVVELEKHITNLNSLIKNGTQQ